jgi:hypothetical protein
MNRRTFLKAALGLPAAGVAAFPFAARAQSNLLKKGLDTLGDTFGGGSGGLSEVKIGKGLKEALRVASTRVVDLVGQTDGYLMDKAIHIPLPGFLGNAQDILSAVGASYLLDDLEVRLNRAAETAAPYAEEIFFDAIEQMTLEDARKILDGPDDAATQYFKRKMTPSLRETFRPIVKDELDNAGAIEAFDRTVARYDDVPFAPSLGENSKDRLIDHGLDGALAGLFHYLAKEEAAIRNNPAKRTTDLLREVFG